MPHFPFISHFSVFTHPPLSTPGCLTCSKDGSIRSQAVLPPCWLLCLRIGALIQDTGSLQVKLPEHVTASPVVQSEEERALQTEWQGKIGAWEFDFPATEKNTVCKNKGLHIDVSLFVYRLTSWRAHIRGYLKLQNRRKRSNTGNSPFRSRVNTQPCWFIPSRRGATQRAHCDQCMGFCYTKLTHTFSLHCIYSIPIKQKWPTF